ncbi:MAG TPA: hypothetical protein VGS15_11100 [Candidatus Acidoferrales bacterium]|nr:hypothetical protein [Candidatus Acidoferrales bacterium]
MPHSRKKGKTQRAYPARAKGKAGSAKAKVCFIISPFGDWNDRYYTDIYCPAVEAAGLDPHRADDLYRPSAIVHDIWEYVKSSRVMLADLTGKNPNVFYELGLAHALAKPVVLVTQSIDDVPFDLRALRVIEYDVEDPEWGVVLKSKIEQAIREVLDSPQVAVLPTFLHAQRAKKQPSISPAEKRLLELEQRVELLSSRARATAPRPIAPGQALELMDRYIRLGMPSDVIVNRLVDRGAPAGWVRDRLDEADKLRRSKRNVRGPKAAAEAEPRIEPPAPQS